MNSTISKQTVAAIKQRENEKKLASTEPKNSEKKSNNFNSEPYNRRYSDDGKTLNNCNCLH